MKSLTTLLQLPLLCLLLGCFSSKEKAPKPLPPKATNELEEFKNDKTIYQQPNENIPPHSPAYPVLRFLDAMRQGSLKPARKYLAEGAKIILENARPEFIESFQILKIHPPKIQTSLQLLFQDNTRQKNYSLTFLVRQTNGFWKIYGAQTHNTTWDYTKHNPITYQNRAIRWIQELRKRTMIYRRRTGKYGTLLDLKKAKLLPEKDFNPHTGIYRGYQYKIFATPRTFYITAIPLLLIPPHKSFYIDQTGILRYNPDGSYPHEGSQPWIKKHPNKNKTAKPS